MTTRRERPEALADELRELTVALRRRTRATPDEALPSRERSVLKRIAEEGELTTADLARLEVITPQAMGTLVLRLEANRLVSRKNDAGHGRKRLVSLTAAGRKALAASQARRLDATARVFSERMSADERRVVARAFSLLRSAFVG